MLKQSQRALDNHVLQDRPRWDVDSAVLGRNNDDGSLEDNSAAKVDIASNSQMVQLDNVGDAADSLLELCHLLEVTAKLDQRSRPEAVGVNDQLTVAQSVQVRLDEHEI